MVGGVKNLSKSDLTPNSAPMARPIVLMLCLVQRDPVPGEEMPATPSPSLILLGGFDLVDANGTLALARKAKGLLAFLALQPDRPHSRDKLAALLWAESAQAQARHSLRQALAGLRKALPNKELLIADNESVALRAIPVDALQFLDLATRNDAAGLEQAMDLYGGELLEGFNLRSEPFEEWLQERRSHVRQLAIAALDQLLALKLEQAPSESAIRLAHRLLALDPLRESGHRALMRLNASLGRGTEALRQYRNCRRLLWRELNVEPEAETVQLHRELNEARQERPAEPAIGAHLPTDTPTDTGRPEATSTEETGPRPAATNPPRAQLRQVSVLQLEWSPPATQPMNDPEAMRGLESSFQMVVTQEIERHLGQLLQLHQESAIAVFGMCHARSDDPERAVRAAVSLRDRVQEEPGGHIRSALTCGSALCEPQTPQLTGAVLHQGREMLRGTAEDEICASHELYQQLAKWVEAGTVPVPGLGVWRIQGIREEPIRATTPLIGRRHELALLRATLESCAETGLGHAFLIRGEAGIGKTRLIEEIERLARKRAWRVRLVRVLDFGGDANGDPAAVLLRALLQSSDEDDSRELLLRLEDIAQNSRFSTTALRSVRRILAPLDATNSESLSATPFGGEGDEQVPPEMRESLIRDFVRQLLTDTANDSPLLLIVEDIHWADRLTLALLASACGTTPAIPLILLLTTRFESEPLDPAWRASMLGAPLTTLDLGPLLADQAMELGRQLNPDNDARVHDCVKRAEGNPLFLEQLLLATTGERQEGVPGSVQSIVLARLDALGEADRNALQAASILGQRFALAHLQQIAAAPDYRPDQLLQQRLLRPDSQGFMFAHALIRDAVYASLPASRRRLLHGAASECFKTIDPVLYARHMTKSGAGDSGQAHVLGARHLLRGLRYDQAIELAREGLEHTAAADLLGKLHQLIGDTLIRIGRNAEARPHFEAAERLACNASQRGQASLGIAKIQSIFDELEPALATLEQAASVALVAEDQALLADIHFQRGNVLFSLARLDACLAAHQELARYARASGSKRHAALAEGGLGDAYYLRGQMITADRHYRCCVERARACGAVELIAPHLGMQAYTTFYANRLDEGISTAEEALLIAEELHDVRGEVLAVGALTPMLVHSGDADRALELSRRGIELARQIGSKRFEADSLMTLGEAYGLKGDRALGVELEQQALRALGEEGIPHGGALIMSTMAYLCEDPTQRYAYLAEGERLLAGEAISHNILHFHQNAMRVRLEDRDWDRVEPHARALADYTRREPLPWADFYIRRARTLALLGRGERDAGLDRTLTELIREAEAAQLYSALPELTAGLALLTR